MKFMQITAAAAIAFALSMTSCTETPPPAAPAPADNTPAVMKGDQNLKVDVAASTLHWKGDMLGLYSHEGNINITSGNVVLKDGKISGGTFVIDMATIKPTDANYNPKEGKTAEALVGHLSSPEFFDVANNPTATFTVNSVTGNTGKGTLSLRGKTGEETLENVVITPDGDGVKVTATVKFNRQNYGVAYSTGAKDKILSDDISLDVTLVAKK